MKPLGVAFLTFFLAGSGLLNTIPLTAPLYVQAVSGSEEPVPILTTHGDAQRRAVSDPRAAEYEEALSAVPRRTQMVGTASRATNPSGASYMIPIRYWAPDTEAYRTVYLRVTPSETVDMVAKRAAKLTRGAIPLQKAMLYLSDEQLPLHKHFLTYYNAIRNGGLVELDYTWRPNGKPRSPFVSADAI